MAPLKERRRFWRSLSTKLKRKQLDESRYLAFSVALIYAIVSVFWIAYSDHLLVSWVASLEILTKLQTLKGWLFVGCTSLILYSLIQRGTRKLQQKHQLLQNIINSTNDAIFVKDSRGRYLVINKTAARFLGTQPVNILGKFDQQFFTAEDTQRIRSIEETILRTGQSAEIEEFLTINGVSRWFSTTKSLCLDAQSRPVGIVGVARDVTQRKQAEANLRDSEERLRLALRATQQGLYDLNIQTGEAIIDAEYASMLGFDLDEFHETDTRWIERLHPDDRENITKIYRAYIAGEIPDYRVEFRQRTKSGEWKWILSLGQVVAWDDAGQPLRMLGTHTDISDRKRAEEEFRQSEQLRAELKLLENIFEIILAGYWDWNIPANQEYLSPTFKRMFGYEDDELPNTPESWQKLIFSEDLSGVVECFNQHVSSHGQVPYYNEVRYHHKNGSTVWVICCGCVIEWGADGSPLRVIGCHINITDRKQAEEHLRLSNEQISLANAELTRATRLKDEFLASMSHELRTPLNSILGMSEMLQEEVFGALNEKQQQSVEVISQSGNHLLNLINDILDLAKIESGKMALEMISTSIASLCSFSLNFVKQVAHQKDIRLETQIPENLDNIDVDERRIRQALINLLSNAVKFTPEGGQVYLKVVQDKIKKIVQFSVIDTGIGIGKKDIPRLFQSFVQIDSKLNRQYNGTGLGLALVKQITELHQGTVEVRSTIGQGSCFTITLPYASNPILTQLQVIQPELDQHIEPLSGNVLETEGLLSQPLILLAEDNQANIDTFSSYLKSFGFRLIVATDGQEATDLAKKYKPDIILMDVQMPGVDGLEATRRIRADQDLAETPIIALTALAMAGDREKCMDAGMTEYLVKPVSLKQLLSSIRQLLAMPK